MKHQKVKQNIQKDMNNTRFCRFKCELRFFTLCGFQQVHATCLSYNNFCWIKHNKLHGMKLKIFLKIDCHLILKINFSDINRVGKWEKERLVTYLPGETISKQNLLSISSRGLTLHSRRSSDAMLTCWPCNIETSITICHHWNWQIK